MKERNEKRCAFLSCIILLCLGALARAANPITKLTFCDWTVVSCPSSNAVTDSSTMPTFNVAERTHTYNLNASFTGQPNFSVKFTPSGDCLGWMWWSNQARDDNSVPYTVWDNGWAVDAGSLAYNTQKTCSVSADSGGTKKNYGFYYKATWLCAPTTTATLRISVPAPNTMAVYNVVMGHSATVPTQWIFTVDTQCSCSIFDVTFNTTLTGSQTSSLHFTAGCGNWWEWVRTLSSNFTVKPGLYYLNVTMQNTRDSSNFSASDTCKVCVQEYPLAPSLISPEKGEVITTTLKPTFSWSSASFGVTCDDAIEYYYIKIIGGASVVDQLITVSEPQSSTLTWTPTTQSLLENTDYTWTVTALKRRGASDTTNCSLSYSFSTCTVTAPMKPSLTPCGSENPVYLNWTAPVSWGSECGISNRKYNIFFALGRYPSTSDKQNTNPIDENFWIIPGGLSDGTYTWYVDAIAAGGTSSSESSTFTICTAAAPSSAAIVSPADTQRFLNLGLVITFSWDWSYQNTWGTQCAGVTTQLFELFVNDTNISNSTETEITTTVSPGYHTWLVKSFNGFYTSSSSSATFFVCESTVPSTPNISSMIPCSNDSNSSSSRLFLWDSVEDWGQACESTVKTYTVFVASSSGKIIVSSTVNHPSTSLLVNLNEAGLYSWWITTSNGLSSATTVNISWEVCVPEAPSGIELSTPANHATVVTPEVTFEWTISDWGIPCTTLVSNFTIYLGNSSTTMAPIGQTTGALYYSYNLTSLSGTLSWKVEAFNGNLRASSSVRQFVSNDCTNSPPEPVSLLYPLPGALIRGNNTLLQWEPASFGTYCKNSSFPGVYQVYLNGTLFISVLGNEAAEVTTPYEAEGNWTWWVESFNGNATTLSSSRTFALCYPESPVTPILSPFQIFVSNVSLWWNATWGKSCNEELEFVLNVTGKSFNLVQHLPSTQSTFVMRSQDYSFLDGETYSWYLLLKKDDKSAFAKSNFSVCLPSAEQLSINFPDVTSYNGTVFFQWTTANGNACGESSSYFIYILLLSPRTEYWFTVPETRYTALLQAGKYNWNVRADNGILGSYANNRTNGAFEVCIAVSPSTPVLILPNASSIAVAPITLTWRTADPVLGTPCGPQQGSPSIFIFMASNLGILFSDASLMKILQPTSTSWLVPDTLSEGLWYWRVVVFNGAENSFSLTSSFTKCIPSGPSNVTEMTPKDDLNTPLSSVTLSWNAPTDIGNVCGLSSDLVYRISLSQHEPPDFFSETSETSISVPGLSQGYWYWDIKVRNARGLEAHGRTSSFWMCISTFPSVVAIQYPLRGDFISESSFNMSFYSSGDWGNVCLSPEPENYYNVIYGQKDFNETVRLSGDLTGLINIPVWNLTFGRQQWFWQVFSVNRERQSTPSEKIFFKICKLPTATTLLYPSNNSTNITNLELTLQWMPITSDMVGAPCAETLSLASITVFMNTEEELLLNNWTSPVSAVFSAFTTGIDYTIIEELTLNTTYYWRVLLSNGYDSATSAVFAFTTRPHDCASLNCSHAVCEEPLIFCRCFPGWNGTTCNIFVGSSEEDTKDNHGVAIGVGVGVAILCLGAILGILVLGLVFLRKRRRQFEIPNFQSLIFTPVTLPCISDSERAEAERHIPEIEEMVKMETSFARVDIIIDTMDITMADNMCKALVYAYINHGRGLELMLHLISEDIRHTSSETTLFRNNSPSSKAFKFYSKIVGIEYLFRSLAVLFAELKKHRESNTDSDQSGDSVQLFESQLEVDPSKMAAESDGMLNTILLELMSQKFITQITRSAQHLPEELQRICCHIHKEVKARFPGSENIAIGAFMFLRFYCTAIAIPEQYGLLKEPPDSSFRRELTLVCKVLQALANQMEFGNKEQFMVDLNPFIHSNIPTVNKFYEAILKTQELATVVTEKVVEVPEKMYQDALLALAAQISVAKPTRNSLHE